MAKNACQNGPAMARFPQPIQDFGNAFVALQEKRHRADYDPDERHYKHAETVIVSFQKAPITDRRAFAAHVLVRPRR